MRRLFPLIILLLAVFVTNAQAPLIGHIILKEDGSKIDIHQRPAQDGTLFMKMFIVADFHAEYSKGVYHDQNGQPVLIQMKEIDEVVIDNERYMQLDKELYRVVAETGDHVLLESDPSYNPGLARYYFYIFGKEKGKLIQKKVWHSWNSEPDRKNFDRHIKPLFAACSELLESVEKEPVNQLSS